ncbi:MAG TPA: DnaJ family domain-containing protein [Longilinea sp.]|nr:DnaJ family domain-containing protein [Longilinea sp.]
MSSFDRIVEEKIQAALQAGKFDQLSGKGKPLNLEENPYEPDGWGMAFRLIRQNGFSLPWIEVGMTIENERLLAHQLLRSACRESGSEDCRIAHELFASRIESLNREIAQYNLRVPAAVFQRSRLDLETERAAALSEMSRPAADESRS